MQGQQQQFTTYATPLGCSAVLFTLLATMAILFKEEEWKLFFCCLLICSLRKLFEESGGPGVNVRIGAAGREFMLLFSCDIWLAKARNKAPWGRRLFDTCPTTMCLKLCTGTQYALCHVNQTRSLAVRCALATHLPAALRFVFARVESGLL